MDKHLAFQIPDNAMDRTTPRLRRGSLALCIESDGAPLEDGEVSIFKNGYDKPLIRRAMEAAPDTWVLVAESSTPEEYPAIDLSALDGAARHVRVASVYGVFSYLKLIP